MRRRRIWVWVWLVVVALAALAVAEYAALAWIAPRYAVYALRQAFGRQVTVDHAALQFPFTLVFEDVRWDQEWPVTGYRVKRLVIRPAWVSWSRRKLWLRSIEIEQPWVSATRTAKGALRSPVPSLRAELSAPVEAPGAGWSVSVASLSLTDGTLAFLDEQIARPFHGALDHVSLVAGPLIWPPTGGPIALAIRGEAVGSRGEAAPVYCSGWLNPATRDLDASCQLESLPLAAFGPYYDQGRVQVRVYDATVMSTSHWSARHNQLSGHIQLTIGNLNEGDVSIRGNTVVDIKRLAGGEPATLTGEVQVSGPLDAPSRWESELVPGNEMVQRIMRPLLDRGREMIHLHLGRETIELGIGTATKDEMSDIEAAGKEVERTLEMLTPLRLPEIPAPAASPETPATLSAGPETAPAPQVAPAVAEQAPAAPNGGTEPASQAPEAAGGSEATAEPRQAADTPMPLVAPAAPPAPAVPEPVAPPANPPPSSPVSR